MNLTDQNVVSGAPKISAAPAVSLLPLPAQPPQENLKIFIKNISENVPDSVMESILTELGPINYFRRVAADKKQGVSSATAEFSTAEGLVNCLRNLHKFELYGKRIEVFPSQAAKNGAAEYIESIRNSLSQEHSSLNETQMNELLEKQLAIAEKPKVDKITLLAEEFEKNISKIVKEEKKTGHKLYTEEKLNSISQKYGLKNSKDLEENFISDLKSWIEKEAEWKAYKDKLLEEEKRLFETKRELLEEELNGSHRPETVNDIARSTNRKILQEDLERAGLLDLAEFLGIEIKRRKEEKRYESFEHKNSDRREGRRKEEELGEREVSPLGTHREKGSSKGNGKRGRDSLGKESDFLVEEREGRRSKADEAPLEKSQILLKEKIQNEKLKNELMKDSGKLNYLIRLRKKIPKSINELFQVKMKWDLLEKVNL